ncbi:Universal stress protein A-like protein [Bienertia sinuspersici]
MAALIPLAELCDTEVMHGYGVEVEPEVLDLLRTISTQLQVNVVWKLYWGDPREKICEAVVSFHLENLVMGSRGLGALQRSVQLLYHIMQYCHSLFGRC